MCLRSSCTPRNTSFANGGTGSWVPPTPQWAFPVEEKWCICIFEHARSKSDIGGAWGRRHGVEVPKCNLAPLPKVSKIRRGVPLRKAFVHTAKSAKSGNIEKVRTSPSENIEECRILAEKWGKCTPVLGVHFPHFSARLRHSSYFRGGEFVSPLPS